MLLTEKIANKVRGNTADKYNDVLAKPFGKVFALNNIIPFKKRRRLEQSVWGKVQDEVTLKVAPTLNQNVIAVESTLHER